MKTKIAIFGQGEFINIAKESVQGMINNNLDIDVTVCDFNDKYLKVLTDLEAMKTDIIITGHLNKKILEQKTSIPVISLKLTPTDLFIALQKSFPHFTHIAIALSHIEDLKYDYSILEELLHVKFHYLSYQSYNELEEKIKGFLRTSGNIIGTGYAVELANRYGMKGTLIYSEESIKESIERAMEIVHFKKKEERHAKQLKTIINSVKDGIIATNGDNEIITVNQSVYHSLSLSEDYLTGKGLSQVFSNKTLINADNFQNEIISFGNFKMNTNKVPIFQQEQEIGHVIIFQDITNIQEIEQNYRIQNEAKGLVAKGSFNDIFNTTPIMKRTIDRAKTFSKTDSTILISGETGTGKELIAQSIHNFSKRGQYPFVTINCAALPESLLESELFGYEKGAFTGALKEGKKGLFEIANQGTVFLDEISSTSIQFQAKLLRVLQEKEVVRIGGDRVIPVKIRVIAATNENLYQMAKDHKFRSDLYYRINVLNIKLPPLRNRIKDIPLLTREFISRQNKELYSYIEPFVEPLCHELLQYIFPGNVRELYNILERFVVLSEVEDQLSFEGYRQLLIECMGLDSDQNRSIFNQNIKIELKKNYKDTLMEAERLILGKYMEIFSCDKTTLARELGMSRTTLFRKLKELDTQ